MARHVVKGDLVEVTAGQSQGRQGKLLRVMPDRNLVIVEGVNVRKKHIRASQQNPQGGVVEKEMPIHISNISPVADGKPSRVRFETKPDGSKLRIAVKTGEQLGIPIRKARKD